MYDEPGVRLAGVQALLPLVLGVAALARVGVVTTLVGLTVVAGAGSLTLPRGAAALSGLVAWAWTTGFTENRYGLLTFSSGDLVRLGASILGALLVAVLARRLWGRLGTHWSRDQTAPPP
jgi:hypothetical protein